MKHPLKSPLKLPLVCSVFLSLLLVNACASGPAASSAALPSAPVAAASSPTGVIQMGKAPHGMAANADFVYNSNAGENTISVVDVKSEKVVKLLSLPEGSPGYVKASHDGKYMLVLSSAGKLHIYEPGSTAGSTAGAEHKLVQTLDAGKGPDKLLLSPDDRHVYVSLTGEAGIAHFDFSQGLQAPPERKLIAAGAPSADGKGHRSLALALGWLLTPNPGDNSVSLISPSGEAKTLRDGNSPGPVALGYQGETLSKVIVGNTASHTITLFDPSSDQKVTIADAGQSPTDVLVLPERGRAYITMAGSNQVAVIDYFKGELIGKVATGQRPVHIYAAPELTALPDMSVKHEGHDHISAQEIWVGNDSGDSVTVFDADSLEVKATHKVGKGHHKMAFAHNKAFISNITDGTLSVIQRGQPDHRESR